MNIDDNFCPDCNCKVSHDWCEHDAPHDTLILNMGVCWGRHNIPEAVDGFIFPEVIDIKNVKALEVAAFDVLNNNPNARLNLFITGLTVAVIAVLNSARRLGMPVTAWHFDRETGKFFPQKIV